MKTLTQCLVLIATTTLLTACGAHFPADSDLRRQAKADREARLATLPASVLPDAALEKTSTYEREAMDYIYAYMPQHDIVDYTPDFHLMLIRAARQAANEMTWGSSIPDEIFRQSVFPTRVADEPLDSARVKLYAELSPIVKKVGMSQAIDEIRLWCSDHVVCFPEGERTASPLTTLRSGIGGRREVSVLLATALRSVGIPARLVDASPDRTAHDDRAWVEAWADGQWHSLSPNDPTAGAEGGHDDPNVGACAMPSTTIYGPEGGETDELTTLVGRNARRINLAPHYGPSAQASIRVNKADGQPAVGAKVELMEHTPQGVTVATRLTTDNQGRATLIALKGEMLAFAVAEGQCGVGVLSVGSGQELTISLGEPTGKPTELILSPAPQSLPTGLIGLPNPLSSTASKDFMTEGDARKFAQLYKLPQVEMAARFITDARANHPTITNFMARLRSEKSKKGGFDMMDRLTEKDMRDITLSALIDHMQSHVCRNAEYFRLYVRCPRIADEVITPYKVFFDKQFSQQQRSAFASDPYTLAQWVVKHVRVDDTCNTGAPPLSPQGVWRTRVADLHSRDVFFVALARSMGIPTRLDPVSGEPQILRDAEVPLNISLQSVAEEPSQDQQQAKGRLSLTQDRRADNRYPDDFSLWRVDRQTDLAGVMLLDNNNVLGRTDGVWDNLFNGGASLDPGTYVLMQSADTGKGQIKWRLTTFRLSQKQNLSIAL